MALSGLMALIALLALLALLVVSTLLNPYINPNAPLVALSSYIGITGSLYYMRSQYKLQMQKPR